MVSSGLPGVIGLMIALWCADRCGLFLGRRAGAAFARGLRSKNRMAPPPEMGLNQPLYVAIWT